MNQSKRNFFKFRKSPIKKANLNQNNTDLEAENERNKDTIIKLKEQIVAKDKEISDLKVSKIRNEEQFNKTMKIFDEIVRESDKSTVQGMKEIERNISNNYNKNKRYFSKNNNNNDINKYNTIENNKKTNHISENNNNNYKNSNINQNNNENENDENNNNNNNEEIKPKIHLKKSQRKRLNELLNIHSLKLKVNQQNNILLKKEKEIEKLKKPEKNVRRKPTSNGESLNRKECRASNKFSGRKQRRRKNGKII